jgi:hypothetical protein
MNRKLLIINEKDNVGVVLEPAEKGDTCVSKQVTVEALEPIQFAHKIALADIQKNEDIVKYGENIGFAISDIKKGQWIHLHNMGCKRGKN